MVKINFYYYCCFLNNTMIHITYIIIYFHTIIIFMVNNMVGEACSEYERQERCIECFGGETS